MDMPLISVIIPVYNVENYLKRCIDSVLAQSYRNIEIILINDGSTDNSGKICIYYADCDKRIKVIHKENGGLSDARNAGIEMAKGEYLAFVDSDDFVHEEYLQRLYSNLLIRHADISICGYEKGSKRSFTRKKNRESTIEIFSSSEMLENWHDKYKNVETIAWNKLYKRSLFLDNNIRYPIGYYNEDVQTTHILISKANKIVISDEKLYYYFQRVDSIMGELSEKKIRDCICSQQMRLDFFAKQKYKKAYERLMIKLQKYNMLMYCKSTKVKSREIRNYLLEMFIGQYEQVCACSVITKREIFLFRTFKKYHKIFGILFAFGEK